MKALQSMLYALYRPGQQARGSEQRPLSTREAPNAGDVQRDATTSAQPGSSWYRCSQQGTMQRTMGPSCLQDHPDLRSGRAEPTAGPGGAPQSAPSSATGVRMALTHIDNRIATSSLAVPAHQHASEGLRVGVEAPPRAVKRSRPSAPEQGVATDIDGMGFSCYSGSGRALGGSGRASFSAGASTTMARYGKLYLLVHGV